MKCSKCKFANPEGAKFCIECGQHFGEEVARMSELAIEGERKQVTVLFSDLTGYTAMSEKLDPEEVKEITRRIFSEISKIVAKYDGFIEKYAGDAVMALFGVPEAHEDDPIRAIKVAREIHELVNEISPEVESRIGQSISMHTGINTGLVVTGEVNMARGTHGIAGEPINLASRLSNLAKPGEILVGPETYIQTESYFNFESLGPAKLKGKSESVHVYLVTMPKEQPRKVHRIQGLRAELVGRKIELAKLKEASERLWKGKGSIFSVCGDAGTGKSRLIEEFKASLDLEKLQWQEGHAYPYTQNIPYFPLINLLSRAFQVKEGDSQEKVRLKVESGIEILIGKKADVIPYIGNLFSLSYPEVEGISPDSWKYHLQKAVNEILSALAQRAPTVICFEDLHWADPSSLEFFRMLLTQTRHPALFLCAYRPNINLFTDFQLGALGDLYQEITLHDLSNREMLDMLESLLKTETIPPDLIKFIQNNIEGNPFYLEEVINSLIESDTLICEKENWVVSKTISKSEVPPTIHGVISARIDRLGNETKKILQEASVIGRTFLYEILKMVSDYKVDIDKYLNILEQYDLIRARSLGPDLEYVFKHALTQEVVYNGLLKKERQKIHERIGIIMEKVFHSRLTEFYETLAFHYKRGQSITKAIEYLVKSGEKSLGRYSLEESHQYFLQAFELLDKEAKKTIKDKERLIDLINKWSLVFHFRGAYSDLIDLLKPHEDMASALDDKVKIGLLFTWFGYALRAKERLIESYQYLIKALKIGEETENIKIVGQSCAYLAYTCADMGLLDDAVSFGERALEISQSMKTDQELLRFALTGLGMVSWFRGDRKRTDELGKALLDHGVKKSDLRCIVQGHNVIGWGNIVDGNYPSAIECFEKAINVSLDPIFSNMARMALGLSYLSTGKLLKAEKTLEEVIKYNEKYGMHYVGSAAQILKGIILIAKGYFGQGVKVSEDVLRVHNKNNSKYRLAAHHTLLGNVYLQMVQRTRPMSLTLFIRNFGFLIRNILFVSKKAEYHFNTAIDISKDIGAKGILGQAWFGLGSLHIAKGRIEQARKCFYEAVQVFEICDAKVYLKQAQAALSALA